MSEEAFFANMGVEPEKVEETPQEQPQEEAQPQEAPQEQPQQESSLHTETPSEDKPSEEVVSTETPSSEQEEEVFSIETDEDLAKFASEHFGKEISPDRLKSLLEEQEAANPYANDTIKELNDAVAKGWSVSDFMELKMTDYSAMSDLDVVSKKMQRDYPSLTKEEINKKLTRQFKLDDSRFDDDEIEEGALDLRLAAEDSRKYFNSLKEQYPTEIQNTAVQQAQQPEIPQEQVEAFTTAMNNSISNLNSFEIGGVKYDVDASLKEKIQGAPMDIGDMYLDGDNFNFDKYNQLRAFAVDPERFVKTIKAETEAKVLADLKNKRNNTQMEPEAHKPDQVVDSKKANEALAREFIGGNNKYTF